VKKVLYILTVLLSITTNISAQEDWIKIYGDDEDVYVYDLIETYDGGYAFAGFDRYNSSSGIKTGFLVKTDINGNILWKKTIGHNSDNGVTLNALKQTFDGGYILFGSNYRYGGSNLMLMKLNSCGEKEWNKTFISVGQPQYAYNVIQMPDSTYLLQLAYWGNDIANKRIWLFKVDTNGEIIWKKAQAQWTLGTNDEEAFGLSKNNSNEYLIAGQYYQWEPGYDTSLRWQRPIFIKVDSNGNEIWHRIWGVGDFFVGYAVNAVFNSRDYVYGVGLREEEADGSNPSLFKLDPDGNQIFQKDLFQADGGGSGTINIVGDSAFYLSATTRDFSGITNLMVMKTDSMGNIINSKQYLLEIESGAMANTIITHDNKYLATGSFYTGNNFDIYLWKFNSDLEYDSIYTQPQIYDSLCPYQIVSDTISIDTTIVNLDEIYVEFNSMKIMPNPAKNHLIVSLGEMQKGTELKLINSAGVEIKNILLKEDQSDYEINTTYFSSGIYVMVLLNKESVVERKKVLIVK